MKKAILVAFALNASHYAPPPRPVHTGGDDNPYCEIALEGMLQEQKNIKNGCPMGACEEWYWRSAAWFHALGCSM